MDSDPLALERGELERVIRAELDKRFPLINGLSRGEYEAISTAAAEAVIAHVVAEDAAAVGASRTSPGEIDLAKHGETPGLDLEAIEQWLPDHNWHTSPGDTYRLIAEVRRLRDLVAEFRKRDEAATKTIERLRRDNEALTSALQPAADIIRNEGTGHV